MCSRSLPLRLFQNLQLSVGDAVHVPARAGLFVCCRSGKLLMNNAGWWWCVDSWDGWELPSRVSVIMSHFPSALFHPFITTNCIFYVFCNFSSPTPPACACFSVDQCLKEFVGFKIQTFWIMQLKVSSWLVSKLIPLAYISGLDWYLIIYSQSFSRRFLFISLRNCLKINHVYAALEKTEKPLMVFPPDIDSWTLLELKH